jgi:uncharacterized protein with NRDE domain
MKDAGNYSNYNYLMGYVDALKWLISEVDWYGKRKKSNTSYYICNNVVDV